MIITDSLGMPRDSIAYEDTWVYKLQKKYSKCEFIDRSQRGATTNILKSSDLLEVYAQNITIVQLGIVDCVPRLFSKYENLIISKMPNKISNILINILKRTRKRSVERSYVNEKCFKENIEQYCSRAREINAFVVFVKICKPSRVYERNINGLGNIVSIYNSIYDDIKKKFENIIIVEPFHGHTELDDFFIDDGYHLSTLGNEQLYSEIHGALIKLCLERI